MSLELSLSARREITKKYAKAYRRGSKSEKGRLLDSLCEATGWSRDNARRQIRAAAERKGAVAVVKVRQPRPRTYGYDTLKLLEWIWRVAGMPSGKYLVSVMEIWLVKMERFGEFGHLAERLSDHTRTQLLNISAATIDRQLKPIKDREQIRGISGTKPGSLLRTEIPVRTAADEHEQAPGFCEIDLVLHCGPTASGTFARTMTTTDVHTGWTENIALKNGAHKWVLEAMPIIEDRLPFPLVGVDFDNGAEFINHELIHWANGRQIYFTRSRPYQKNDNAHVEQKNNDIVRRHAFYYRYDTARELKLLNTLYSLVRVRFNFFTGTAKAIGWRTRADGRNTRVYDAPRTPYQRVLDHPALLTDESKAHLKRVFEDTNPVELTRQINAIQQELINLAEEKTLALRPKNPTQKLEAFSRAKTNEARTHLSRAS